MRECQYKFFRSFISYGKEALHFSLAESAKKLDWLLFGDKVCAR
jgi:hypothetical protein